MKRILFRADGNSEVGLGHLYRIFALMALAKQNTDVLLLTSSNTTLHAIPEDFQYALLPENVDINEEPGWIAIHYPSHTYQIVADGYHFTTDWHRAFKEKGYRLTYVDDLCKGHQYADIIINHSLAVQFTDYDTEPYTRLALGSHYAILRPAFLEAAARKREIAAIHKALICFGGADPFDLSQKTALALVAFSQIEEIHIVLGAAYPHQEIFLLEVAESRIWIHQNLPEQQLAQLMTQCDLAIASASTILYELCSVKMPVIAGYYVPNQKGLYEGCVARGLIYEAGDLTEADVSSLKKQISRVLSLPDHKAVLNAQSSAFDSRIRERFQILFADIRYRKATENDVLLIYEWANDRVSRENSYFSEPIPLESHRAWFSKKINDSSSTIFIAEYEGVPAGMLRYDVLGDHAVVGISIAQAFRGKGLAPEFLKGSAKLFFQSNDLSVEAFIKQQNQASVRSFEKAGYRRLREEVIHGSPSFIYKLEKNDVQ